MNQKVILLALVIIILIAVFLYLGGYFTLVEHEHPGHGVAGQFGLRDPQFYEGFYNRREHQMPGHGVAGQFGLRDPQFYERFYSSGSGQRYKSEADRSTELTIPTKDFNSRELSYYMRR